jgi:hypothetical protein
LLRRKRFADSSLAPQTKNHADPFGQDRGETARDRKLIHNSTSIQVGAD